MVEDNEKIGLRGWGDCPGDLLMMIFKQLDSKALLNCMAVNYWWRDVVDYVAQHSGSWADIAREGMLNEGTTYRRKSSLTTMGWRDLYINSHLWLCAGEADVKWSHLCHHDDIKSIHIYRGFLIITHGQYDRQYYKIGEVMQELRAVPKNTNKEGPLARAVRESNLTTNLSRSEEGHIVEGVDHMILKLIKEGPFKRLIVYDDKCYYVLDDRNIMRCFKWMESSENWQDLTLARYYGCNKSISDIHVSHGNVYILLRSGNVMQVDRQGRNFEMLFGLDFPPQTLAYFARMFYSNIPMKKIDRIFELDIPEYSTGQNVMFHKFSAVVAVPSDKEFKVNYHEGSEHVVFECPNLTAATEHGDMLFLGYKDGRVDVCSSKNLLQNGYVPELSVNVQDSCLHLDQDVDPAIVALDVYELKGSHYLFVATSTNIYRLEIAHDENIINSLDVLNIHS